MKNLVKTTDRIMECGVEIRNARAQYKAHQKAHNEYLERGMFEEAKDLELILNTHSGEYIGWKIYLRLQLSIALTELENLN